MTSLTKSTKPLKISQIERKWHLVDLKSKALGRATTQISGFLQGKHKTNYVSYLDSGDYVVVVNAKTLILTGKKAETKEYTRYSGYPSGLRTIAFREMSERNPEQIVRRAVSGMLPKNKHRDRRLARLFIFPEDTHTYTDKFQVVKQ